MIVSAVKGLNAALRWISGGLLAGILVIILLQIAMRSTQGRGLAWGNELATYFLVWSVCLGLAVAFFERTHLGVELLVSKLGRLRRPVEILAFLITILFLAVLVYYGWSMVESGMGRTSPGLGVPMGYVYLALPVAGVVGILNIIAVMFTGKQPESRVDEIVESELEIAETGTSQGREELGLGPSEWEQDIDSRASDDEGDERRS